MTKSIIIVVLVWFWCVAMTYAVHDFLTGSAAVEVRLIGSCQGRLLAAMEEDEFPLGCDWIEPIRFE